MVIRNDLTNEQYHAADGLSASAIKLILECPKKYYWRYIEGNHPEQTPAMKDGAAIHMYILEPELFDKTYFIAEEVPRRGTKAWDDLILLADGKEIISHEKTCQFIDIKKSLASYPAAMRMLSDGVTEQSIFWTDPDTGLLLKTRPDYINRRIKSVFDLKTTIDASASGFSRAIFNYGYYIQAAMAIDGLKAVTGEDFSAVNIAIEKSEPYCVGAYCLDNNAIEMGRYQYKRALERYMECKKNNIWPSYADKVETISIPSWAENQLNNEVIYG